MTHFSVNGKEVEFSSSQEQPVQELMEEVRRQFNNESALIASIIVNGNELNGEDEAALAGLKVSQIDTIEVITRHPRELAEETLQSLMEFTSYLEGFSRQAATSLADGKPTTDFAKLIDGIETFTEALLSAKQIMRIGFLEPVNVLEADLASILADLVQYELSGQREYVVELMYNHLPLNLQDWRLEGIPALIRARDS